MASISVIIPTIGRDTLESTINSIQAQTFDDYEIIKVFDNDRRGSVWAKNEGAKGATSPFLFFCDDDVILVPDAFERLVEALNLVLEASFAYGDYEYQDHPLYKADGVMKAQPFDAEELMKNNYISTMSLIRRPAFEAVGGFPEGYPEDWLLWKKLVEAGHSGVYSPGVLFSTRFTEDCQMAKMFRGEL